MIGWIFLKKQLNFFILFYFKKYGKKMLQENTYPTFDAVYINWILHQPAG